VGGELLDGAVEGGDRDVGGRERSLGQRGRQLFGRRLAAALEGRAEGEDGGHSERVQSVGEHDPQGEGFSPAVREADEPAVGVSQVIQQGRAVDRLGPGFGVGEAQAPSGSRPARVRGAAGQRRVDEPRRGTHPEMAEPRDGLGADQLAH